MIEFWQARSRETLGHVYSECLLLHLMAKQSVVQVTGHTCLIHSKHLHCPLHTVKGGALPHILNNKACATQPCLSDETHLLGTRTDRCWTLLGDQTKPDWDDIKVAVYASLQTVRHQNLCSCTAVSFQPVVVSMGSFWLSLSSMVTSSLESCSFTM